MKIRVYPSGDWIDAQDADEMEDGWMGDDYMTVDVPEDMIEDIDTFAYELVN